MTSSVELYLEANDINNFPEKATQRLIEDLRRKREIVWMCNPYIPLSVYEKILNGLSCTQRKRYDQKSTMTVIPCWSNLPEEHVLEMIENEFMYQESINPIEDEDEDDFE